MGKKIVVLNGSPRAKGNTAALIQAFADGVAAAGHSVTRFDLQKMNIHPCLGCCGGGKDPASPCVQKDDMDKIYSAYREADLICLASPLYYWTISGQLKCALDRLFAVAECNEALENPKKECVLLMAAEAGVDIVDTAISSLSSQTSQPSMNSLVACLEGQERDTGLDLEELQQLTDYWEDVRPYYHRFEGAITSPATDIYRYEIPGGQYTNLKPQVESFGLGHRFKEVKEKYKEVNEILGDIVKVTPSSKMVGDLAIFMVQNNLDKDNIVEKAAQLNFPDSCISYFKGMMGQPLGGFPEALQKAILKGEEPIHCRPGELLPDVDFEDICKQMGPIAKEHNSNVKRVAISWLLYPKVAEEYIRHREEYDDLSRMESHAFFDGLTPGETTEIEIEPGKTVIVKYIGLGDLNDDGTRTVIYELNGAQRQVTVKDMNAVSMVKEIIMADENDPGQVSSSLPGAVSSVLVEVGHEVEENQTVLMIEAMKMETNIVAPKAGIVEKICVQPGDTVKAGELLLVIK